MRKILAVVCMIFIVITLILTACESGPDATPATEPAAQETPAVAPEPTPTPGPAATPKTPARTPQPAPRETPPPATKPAPPAQETPTPEPPADTTPPPAITGLLAGNAYDGCVNLWWNESAAEDLDHYNVYASQAEIADITGIEAVRQIKAKGSNNCQVTGLEDGAAYHFAVTAVDGSGNEEVRVASVSATPTAMPGGTADPDLTVAVYQPDKVWAGTTLMRDCHTTGRPKIIEVNMLGETVWEYAIPPTLSQYTNPGLDAELLTNDNILFVLPTKGVYEIDRDGKVVWSYLTSKISHEADRLPNGNTIFVFGADDQKSDAQVTEINPEGEIVWEWYARDHFDKPPYEDIYDGGWTHTNSVTRLPNGNTLLSPRNFNFVVEVDPEGEVVGTYGEGILIDQHDPEALPNGHILAASHNRPQRAIEIDPATGQAVWQSPPFEFEDIPVRDANRLPNGNTLITTSTRIVEVTADGEIVWQLSVDMTISRPEDSAGMGFYKAERIDPEGQPVQP